MRRSVLQTLRCPRCREGRLVPATDVAELVFGPLRCTCCECSHPVSEGVADLIADRTTPAGVQWGLEQPLVARSYERYLRPALQLALAHRRIDRESEFLLYRALLGNPLGPILDLGCGTGLFARKLARDPGLAPVIGMDLSRPMIEEGVAQAREAGVRVDFLLAEAPALPFLDQTLGAVLQTGSLHLMDDASRLFAEIRRTLVPGGRYVASTYLPPSFPTAWLHHRANLHPRSESDLRSAMAAAGLVNFERMVVEPFILVKAERPLPKA